MSTPSVVPVSGGADLADFIGFPHSLYKKPYDLWVPPLQGERRAFLDPRRNPFFKYAEAELFLARRRGRTVGRIAAVRNPRHNERHGADEGFFGMFECVDDPAVARALFEAVGDWLREHGLLTVLGPMSLSTNHECGMLIDSFDATPSVLMPYNPAYYPSLVELCGFVKAKDLWAWDLEVARIPEDFLAKAEEIGAGSRYKIRALSMRDFDDEVSRVLSVYNEIWEDNWGHVPATEDEFRFIVHALKPMLRSEMMLLAELDGEAVGALIALPDLNMALKAANGRLARYGIPLGFCRFVLKARKINAARLILLGVRERDRDAGVMVQLGARAIRAAQDLGIDRVELSWILEDNDAANGVAQYVGGRHSKTYRLNRRGQ